MIELRGKTEYEIFALRVFSFSSLCKISFSSLIVSISQF